jgi:hypothetical protein
MGHRPVDVEPTTNETLSRPAELVQRAKQLAQLTNFQFGRNSVPMQVGQPVATDTAAAPQPPPPADAPGLARAAPVRAAEARGGNGNVMNGNVIAIVHANNGTGTGNGHYTAAVEDVEDIEDEEVAIAPTKPLAAPAPRTTAQKIEDFYGVKQVGDEVVFAARFEDARKVLIAGDFNNWSPASTPMTSSPVPGMWRMSLPLPRGRYRYRFVVDGKWVTDPNNQYVETNQFGELNNVVEVD